MLILSYWARGPISHLCKTIRFDDLVDPDFYYVCRILISILLDCIFGLRNAYGLINILMDSYWALRPNKQFFGHFEVFVEFLETKYVYEIITRIV